MKKVRKRNVGKRVMPKSRNVRRAQPQERQQTKQQARQQTRQQAGPQVRRTKHRRKKLAKSKILLVPIIVILIACSFAYFAQKEVVSKPTKQIESDLKVETSQSNNRNVFTISPKDENVNIKKTIFYLHGGAYMAEMTKEHWEFIEKLVNDTNAKVIIPDYPLAPKYSYKEVFEMIEPLYEQTINEVGTSNLIMLGDSAGGGLALSLMEKLEKNARVPNKTILISPWLDVSMSNEAMKEVQKKDKNLNINTLKLAGKSYAKDIETTDYLVSPLYGDVSKLKYVTIFTGTNDILNPDVYELQKKAEEKNRNIEVKTYDGAAHNWIIEHKNNKELTEKGYKELVDMIK